MRTAWWPAPSPRRPKSALANGQNIAKVGMAVPQSDLAKGQVMRSVDVTPTRAAMLGGQSRSTGSRASAVCD